MTLRQPHPSAVGQTDARSEAEAAFLREALVPQRTALVAIDFQNDFCAPGGFYATVGNDLAMGQAAARQTAALLPCARDAGVLVVIVRAVYDAPYVSPMMRRFYERKGFPLEYCREGTWGAGFYEIAPEPSDLIVTKHRYSAFVDTPLHAILRAHEIKTVLLAGVATNVCVESTARDAFMYDYDVAVLADCTGSYSEQLYEATLENTRRAFGIVTSAAEATAIWDRAGAEAP
ncbi:MAG TPA: isochorismatase family cysteine hydrolase [Conexibacter sp.]|jgi:ureidoacrylate peracid hydrolase